MKHEVTVYVFDPSGNPLPEARVALMQGKKVLLNEVTNKKGFVKKKIKYNENYNIHFTIRVRKMGYEPWEQKHPIVLLERTNVLHTGPMKVDVFKGTMMDEM